MSEKIFHNQSLSSRQSMPQFPVMQHPLNPDYPASKRRSGANATTPGGDRPRALPIDLQINLDLEQLAQAVGNYIISPNSTIDVVPTARDRTLIRITLGDEPTTASSFIRRLWSVMRAPLSLQYYQWELSPDVQDAVFRYFLSRSGPHGRRLWQDFLNGHHHPQGPAGAVLLQGHFFLWGIWKDENSRPLAHTSAFDKYDFCGFEPLMQR
ncbi:hypothetical protein B0H12DRAFT_1324398 [Mycena haematopus]|nr:hypothetical protein B0H12DRAFT_1324398 [Mycena haematopus]